MMIYSNICKLQIVQEWHLDHFDFLNSLTVVMMLGTWLPAVMVKFVVNASPARNLRQSSVSRSEQSQASSKAAINSELINAFSLQTMISAQILPIFSSFFLRSSNLLSSIFLTARSDSARILSWDWLVILYSIMVFYFSMAIKYSTLTFSICSTFCRIFFGMVGLVTLTDRIQIPGAHSFKSLFKAFINSSSRRSNKSIYIY